MSRHRQRKQGQGRVISPPRPAGSENGRNGHSFAVPPGGLQSPLPSAAKPPAEGLLAPVVRAETAPRPMGAGLPVVSAEAVGALAAELAIFNRRLEDLLSQERPRGRSFEERKETWVLLGALTLVVMFCFVAFYLNQSEMREMQSGLQEDMERAGRTAASSVERAISGFHLERLPEAQGAVERLLKEKDRRDAQHYSDLLAEVQRQSSQSGTRLREDLRGIEDQLVGLRQLSEEIHQLETEIKKANLPGAAEKAVPELAFKKPETGAGRAARAPVGAPQNQPPDPAAGSPGSHVSGGPEKKEGGNSPR
jgi:hypothetical protein